MLEANFLHKKCR